MKVEKPTYYHNLDIKLKLNNLVIDVLYINFEPGAPDWNVSNHSHSSYELHYIPFGRGMLHIEHDTYAITPGTFYMTGPGIYHKQESDPENPMGECCINFDLKISDKSDKKSSFFLQSEVDLITDTLLGTHFWFGKDEDTTLELFRIMEQELENRNIGYHMNICNLITAIIINSIRCCTLQKKAHYLAPQKSYEDNRKTIIDNSFLSEYKTLTKTQLAKKIWVGERQLDRIVKQYYCMCFKEKLMEARLEIAKSLLIHSSLSIDEISTEAGFSNSSYLCALFKKHHKLTPAEFRRQFKAPKQAPSSSSPSPFSSIDVSGEETT